MSKCDIIQEEIKKGKITEKIGEVVVTYYRNRSYLEREIASLLSSKGYDVQSGDVLEETNTKITERLIVTRTF